MKNKLGLTVLLSLCLSLACADDDPRQNKFITLGTAAGPLADAIRSQPANALIVGEDVFLVDAGDGAVGQLAKAGFRLQQVNGLFISHLHLDHTGGVLAVLGLRVQMQVEDTLHIYGPPGTKAFVDGLIAGLEPAMKAASGMPGQEWRVNIAVTELVQGGTVELDGLSVIVAENSHFAIPQDSGLPEKAKSLSFRFNLENRSIVYTGDTGPSVNLQQLAEGADVLVSEMMDIEVSLEIIRNMFPNMPKQQLAGIEWHFRAHHVTPQQVGETAQKAGVKSLVVTHMAPSITTADQAERYREEVKQTFDGNVTFANDLDGF